LALQNTYIKISKNKKTKIKKENKGEKNERKI